MTSIADLWSRVAGGGAGGAQRVDDLHPCDLYVAVDPAGRPGLLLVTEERPPQPPVFEVVDVEIGQRADQRWTTGVWLSAPDLRRPFASLCRDAIDALRSVGPRGSAGYLLAHLMRWRRLLAGGTGLLADHELRGLLGELIVLRRCLPLWPASTVLLGWAGPLGGHQDIVLPGLRLEVKTARPGASTVKISSLDQLDVSDARLLLSVVTLAPATESDGRAASAFVEDIRSDLLSAHESGALLELERRLDRGGYDGAPGYDQIFFRLESVRHFAVEDDFPRLLRSTAPPGIDDCVYSVELARCLRHLCDLEV